ncbi:uncharacterized protein LOC113855588 [Abrus precatorius]|uniref:Uncharacterized protein LOC113855588 n=1 Tax=Abrus precatorius TaxID=3816 RepID=A0A8B8KGY4_ABRPR|nr:uncharacterized protein LOC113855588 [Abrus precatorius]
MQNSGVTLVAESLHISTAKDRNPIYVNMSYFGAQQVFYIPDPIDKSWSIVLLSNKFNSLTDGELMDEEVNVEDEPLRGVQQMSMRDIIIDDRDLYARHDYEEDPTIEEEEHSRKTKLKAISKARKLGQKLQVGWNCKGQPIDPNRSKFSHFIGFVTRSTVPISICDWTNVPTNLKDHIWEQVEETFKVQETNKVFVLALAGRHLHAFRTRMRKHVFDKDGNCLPHPPEKYQRFITVTDHWNEFVKQSYAEEFKKESEANAARAKGMSYRYRRSSKGYAQLELELIAASGSNVTSVPRHVLWKAARVNKQGGFDDEGVQKIVAEFVGMEAESESTARNDILGKALGVKEHPGRVRAAGFGGCIRLNSFTSTPIIY